MKKIILTVLLMFISVTVTLGQEEWELPKSWQERDLRPIEKVEMLKELTKDTIDKLTKENEDIGGILRIVDYNIDNSGQWDTLKDGSLLWRFAVCSPKASETSVLFNKFSIPYCAKVYVYGYKDMRNGVMYQWCSNILDDSYNEKLKKWDYMTSSYIQTDTLVIEYYIPPHTKDKGCLSIYRVGHMFSYRESGYIDVNYIGKSGNCQVNINCVEGYDWQIEKRSIAKMVITNSNTNQLSRGTGFLINNIKNDFKPYFLTANHNISKYTETELANIIFLWNYESKECDETVYDTFLIKNTTGATLLASSYDSDFALLELLEDPKNKEGVNPYYLGWDNSGAAEEGGVCIHHPKGDLKKIATYETTPVTSNCYDATYQGYYYNNNNFWKIQFMPTTSGHSVTEKGSSGSPIINNNRRVFGQLYGAGICSDKNCDDPSQDVSNYGKFSVSWDNDTSISKQLKYWLDPNNTNVSVCDGTEYFPCLIGKSPFLTNRIITGDVSINTPIYSAGDIKIKNGETLNITSTLYMAPNTQIIVERGGQLNVKNGTITNACENEYWAGVEVQGSVDDAQTLSNQGKVTLNNAKIENAQCAFFLFTGAMLTGYKSKFTNNQVSISMMDYPNENINTLNQCTFTWNADMIEHEQTELRHISMYGMEGIKFYGCTFNNQLTDTTIITYGIDAIETGIIVNYASEFIRPIFSKFNGLTYGINDLSILTKTCTINNAIFTDNTFGIHATGSIGGLQITKDTFNITPRGVEHLFMAGTPIEAEAIGVVIDDSHGFTVQGNEFLGKGSTYYAVGLQISNTNGYDDIVRNNTFNNLYAGTQALGINCAMQGNLDNITQQGLEYRCNNFAKNIFGIYVNGYGYENSGRKIVGIKQSQGTITQPAYNYSNRNVFDLANFNADTIHYWIYEDDGEINAVGNVEQNTTTNAGVNCNKMKLNLLNSENIAEIDNVLDIQEEENEEIFEDKLDMVEIYLAQKDYEQARNVLNTITDEENEDEIYDYIDYINYLEEYKNLYNIPTELLMDMESHSTRVGQHVRDIFSFKKIRNTDHPKVFIADMEEINQMIENKNSKKETTLKDNISITPNPASTEIELVYSFMENGTYTLSIKDINGNEVIKATLSKDNGKQTIHINNLSTGIYYYTVTKNSTIIKSDKLVVVK